MNEESGAPGGSGASDHSPKEGFEPQQGDQRSHYHQHQHQHQQEVSGEGRAEKGEEPAEAEAARGIESMASTGTDTAAAAPGHVEPDRAHRLEQPHQLVGEKARRQHARRGTEQREAFARQEWLARQMRWRTCNALGQPTCAYAITLAVKMKPLLADTAAVVVEGLSPSTVGQGTHLLWAWQTVCGVAFAGSVQHIVDTSMSRLTVAPGLRCGGGGGLITPQPLSNLGFRGSPSVGTHSSALSPQPSTLNP